MVRPDIKRAKTSKAKHIGVTTFGSLGDFLVRHLARLRGLNPDKDFAHAANRRRPGAVDFIETGKHSSGDAFSSEFYSGATLGIPYSLGFFQRRRVSWSEIVTTRTQIKQDRDLVMRYMRAHIEGIARFKQEPELAKRVIKKMLRLDDEPLAQESGSFSPSTARRALSEINGHEDELRIRRGDRPEFTSTNLEEFIDASFVEELDKSGFIKKLYEK